MPDLIYRVALGPAVLISIFVCGGYFCVRLRLFWLRHPRRAARLMAGERGPRGSFRAVCMALAGTLGVGNIAGVAMALLLGGPGAVFWMLLSAFFAMAVKYAEVVLAMDTREGAPGHRVGGAPFYMRCRGWVGRVLPRVFSLLCVLCAVFQGSMIQGSAATEAICMVSGAKPVYIGIALTCAAALVLSFGREGISSVTGVAIPLATGLYLVMCLSVLIVCRAAIPAAVASVFRCAFTPEAGVGGVAGYLLSSAARQGCAKGLLSNEAGCGTAPMAHITAEGTSPVGQGLWGIFEVFLDTAVICTLTALACLCAAPAGSPDAPITYIADVFAVFYGNAAAPLAAICIAAFAFAAMLTWAFYGLSCLSALTPAAPARRLYLTLYCAAVAVGSVCAPTLLYTLTDLLLACMTLINLTVLAKKADRVVALSAKEGMLKIRSCRTRGCGTAPSHRSQSDAPDCPHTPAR